MDKAGERDAQPSRFEVILARAEAVAAFGWKVARLVWVVVQLTLLLAIAAVLVWIAQWVIEIVELIRAIPDGVSSILDKIPFLDLSSDEKPSPSPPIEDAPPVEEEEQLPGSPVKDTDGDKEGESWLERLLP